MPLKTAVKASKGNSEPENESKLPEVFRFSFTTFIDFPVFRYKSTKTNDLHLNTA